MIQCRQSKTTKCTKSRKVIEGIKRLMYDAPKEAKLLAYITLCRIIFKYTNVGWDSATRSKVPDIELV